ncbi:YceI-like domain-containing protein [Pontibacter mucosus]|uniref:YceI-like domain-containing protein n=1 Tax=Pontibacter mucosus TaxID=1649266 RepID=A0A2T5YQF4_9BACT|nr:YceI family protein [Pontibacter mucosus]PTX21549.1 YceI-like domain-containing protein [Pontibacter mucosus]
MKKVMLAACVLFSALCLTSCEDEELSKSTYALQESASVVTWKGYSPALYHDGSFQVQSQDIQVVDGKVTSGTFTIPIATIENFDLPDEVKPMLLEHLKSPDFFNLALHPTASFRITKMQPLASASEGANNTVTGDFTMLGQTHPISFPANIRLQGSNLKLEASFKLDRTKWGMTYAADPALGDHHILPEVDIQLDLTASRK